MTAHRLGFYVVALAVLFATAHLVWQATHGGVVSHHLLDQRSLPAISNWWGLAIFPLIGGLASWSVQRRAAVEANALVAAAVAAVGALLVGVALSIAFMVDGSGNAPLVVLLAALALGFIFPTYRAEYIFGFIIGMSFVFGLVLPAVIAVVVTAISAAFHLLIRPFVVSTFRRVRG